MSDNKRNYAEPKEFAVNYIIGDKYATVFTSSKQWMAKIDKWAENNPDDVVFTHKDNESYVCSVPLRWLSVRPKTKRVLTEEQKMIARERMKQINQKRMNDKNNEN